MHIIESTIKIPSETAESAFRGMMMVPSHVVIVLTFQAWYHVLLFRI
jgi:hypothetical protein